MQPNYEEMMKKQQQDYQRSRDPFQYGQQVAQRRYSEIMSDIDARRQSTQQSYGDLYTAARQRGVRGLASAGQTLSGGMGQQQRDFVSAIEMQELGRIGQAREGAMRDISLQGQSAFSNAQLEGQQAAQLELQNQQTQFQLYQQRQAILNDPNLSAEERQAQLQMLGQPQTSAELAAAQGSTQAGSLFGAAAGIAVPSAIMAGAAGRANFAAANLAAQTAATRAGRTAGVAAARAVSRTAIMSNAEFAAAKSAAYKNAYKTAAASAKAPQYNMAGKVYGKLVGGVAGKSGWQKALGIGGKALKFAGKAIGVYAIISSVETIAELAGVADGRGFSGLISKEGSTWDKILEGVGF